MSLAPQLPFRKFIRVVLVLAFFLQLLPISSQQTIAAPIDRVTGQEQLLTLPTLDSSSVITAAAALSVSVPLTVSSGLTTIITQSTIITPALVITTAAIGTPTLAVPDTAGITPTNNPALIATPVATSLMTPTITASPIVTTSATAPPTPQPLTATVVMTGPIQPTSVVAPPTPQVSATPTITLNLNNPISTTGTPTATLTALPTEVTPEPETTAEIPPTGGDVVAFNGKVKVHFPAGALDETVDVTVRRPKKENIPDDKRLPPYSLSGQPFEIVAFKKNGQPVNKFKQAITIEVQYDTLPMSGDPENLTLFYYDEKAESWTPLGSTVDTATKQITGYSDHLTVFDFDIQNWEGARLPTVKGFQVALYTGAATYAYPIEVPPGPGGLQPQVQLTYNSQVVDSATSKTQAAWVGMGWSLETGYIERDMNNGSKTTTDDTFQLVLNGSSYRLLPGSDGYWHTDSESFLRIQYTGNVNAYADQDSEWTVWDKTGNKYVFGSVGENHRATYPKNNEKWTWRWSLRQATNIFNQSLSYSYVYEGVSKTTCSGQQEAFCSAGCNDVAVYPSEILYPNNKYRIQFDRVARTDYDTGWNSACASVRFQRSLLDTIRVEHHNGSSWELVRKYKFTYGFGSGYIFPALLWNANGRTPTLTSIQEFGTDGTTALPATTFTYGDSMHMTKADNGYKGSVEYAYQPWAEVQTQDIGMGPQNDGKCSNYSWQALSTTTKDCTSATPSGVRFKGATTTYGTIWENNYFKVFRPGAQYTIQSKFLRWDKIPHEARTGLNEGAIVAWDANGYRPINDNAGGDTVVASSIILPATASRMWLQYEGNGILRGADVYNLLTRYQVTTKTVKDAVTNQSHTFTYSYDEPATNDAVHSAIVATPPGTNQRYFSQPYAEFRGHALVREKGPDGRITLNWFRQDDVRRGQQVRQQMGEELFYDTFDFFNTTTWSSPNGWAWSERTTGDNALRVYNGSANWNITANRTGTVQDGNVVLLQFKVSGTTPSAVLALQVNDNWRWGIQIYSDNKVDAQWNNGGGWNYSTLLSSGAFKRDVWYVLMLGVDSGTDLVRLWERDAAPESGAVLTYGADAMSSGQNWQFKVYANNGSVYLDTYHEMKLLSESETTISASAIALQSGWSLIDKDNKTLVGLNGYWTRPTTEKALTFNNDTKYVGRATDYSYDSYGNVRDVVEKAWNGSAFTPYRTTQYGFYANPTNWLVGLPGYENRYACPGGNCDYGGDDITSSVWYLYDGQSSYTVAPITGKLTGNRAFICYANSSNQCVTFGSHSKTLYSDADYGYDSYGNRTSQTVYTNYGDGGARATATARTTTFAYADGGRNTYKTSETNPASHVTSWSYNYRLSVPTQETDPNSVVTTAEYDLFGRLSKIIRPGDSSASPTVLLGYYDSGVNGTGPFVVNLQQKHSGGAYDLRKVYDGFGQLLQTQIAGAQVNGSAQDVVVDYAYNGYGQVTQQTVPYAISPWNLTGTPYRNQQLGSQPKTVTSYDRYGRVIQVSPPTTSETVYYFYNQDLTVVTRNARGYDTITIQDVWGRVIETHPPSDPWLRYSYTEADRLWKVEKMTGSSSIFGTTTMEYDTAGRKVKMTDMDMGIWTYGYDALGNLTSQTDARGCSTTLTYNDALSRLTNKSYSGPCGVTTAAVVYGYDDMANSNKGKGKRTSMSDGSGSTVWFYGDNRGRLTKETKSITGSGSFITQWGYDSGDQITSMTYPDGEVVNYGYLPQMAANSVSSSNTYVQSTQYDAAGRLNLRTLGSNQLRTNFQYYSWTSQGGRLAWLQSGSDAYNLNLQRFEYNYDPNGNVNWIKDYNAGGTQTQSFGYDALDRLTTASASGGAGGVYGPHSYSYDNYGRLQDSPTGGQYYFLDPAHKHAVTHLGGTAANQQYYWYDPNGNVVGRKRLGGVTQNYGYDAENRLATHNGSEKFVYDGDGNRLKDNMPEGLPNLYIGNYYEIEADNVWVDDGLPAGAITAGDTDTWNWTSSSPVPASGTQAHTSALASGMHQHYFSNASQTLYVNQYGTLYAYVYLDPANPPQEVMLQWYKSNTGWEQRAYWGSDLIAWGTNNTNSRRYMGALPATGGWVRLEVPAALVGLEGQTISGMAFTLYGGKATWDRAGVGTIKKYYYAGNQRIAMRQGTRLYWLLNDHLGSTAHVVEGTTKVQENRYLPWGVTRWGSTSGLTSFMFTGQRVDNSLSDYSDELYYYGARWYDPGLGRFIQPDTIVPNPGDVQSFDRYAYALNNPLKYVDPTGHTPEIDPGTGGSLPPNIQNLYTAFYLQFKEHPIAALYDGDWALFAQDFVAATDAAGAAGLVEYGAVAEQMANTLAGRGKAATGGLMSTGDALRFFLYGLDSDFQAIVAQKENERVGQLMGVLGMSLMFGSALGDPCSFANDTLVATADGLKPITEIKVGDLVYAYHEATGEVGLYPVTAELAHLDREIVTLVINGERIVTTPEHPFYTTASGWTPAGALQVGDEIRRADGSAGIIQAITVDEHPQVMYNLTVADAHTFFVGNSQWLVHNQCGPHHYRPLRQDDLPDTYIAPRGGPRQVRVEHGPYSNRRGWLDNSGDIWVPSRPGESHGGPHWDVQINGGRGGHQNVYVPCPLCASGGD